MLLICRKTGSYGMIRLIHIVSWRGIVFDIDTHPAILCPLVNILQRLLLAWMSRLGWACPPSIFTNFWGSSLNPGDMLANFQFLQSIRNFPVSWPSAHSCLIPCTAPPLLTQFLLVCQGSSQRGAPLRKLSLNSLPSHKASSTFFKLSLHLWVVSCAIWFLMIIFPNQRKLSVDQSHAWLVHLCLSSAFNRLFI